MLIGEKLLLQTADSELGNLLKVKIITEELARWALKQQQSDMLVKHQKENDQGNADFMSRRGNEQIKVN